MIDNSIKFYDMDKQIRDQHKKKIYEHMEIIIKEGEKSKQYAGLVLKWKKIRYIAYKKLSLKEEQEKYGGNEQAAKNTI